MPEKECNREDCPIDSRHVHGFKNIPYPMGKPGRDSGLLPPSEGDVTDHYYDDGVTTSQYGAMFRRGEYKFRVEATTDEARLILTELLPEFLALFLKKNAKYREVQGGYVLGPKGVFPDINRKVGILKARIWDGDGEIDEDTEGVLSDCIGHLFLMWALLRDDDG